jgi:outer membrane immunogenic protein
MKKIAFGFAALSLVFSAPAMAADMAAKSPEMKAPVAAPPSWTGFYIGGEVGGAWARRDASFIPNDPAVAEILNGTFAAGGQPLPPNSFNMSGVTGGIEIGYNWQVDRSLLVGLEADFSGSGLKGSGSSTSVVEAPPTFAQTVTEQQKIDWYGTLRGRIGLLPTPDVLLFTTGGFAYGDVKTSVNHVAVGPFAGGNFAAGNGGSAFQCVSPTTCFAGASSSTRTGWTAGGGLEWLILRNWSAKVEYQYVNLGGGENIVLTATRIGFAGNALSTFNANITRDDFHVVRAGVNYHF